MLSRERHNEFSKIAKFSGGMMKTRGNITLYAIYNNCIVRGNFYHFFPKNGTSFARNTNIYKIFKSTFSSLYNISLANV